MRLPNGERAIDMYSRHILRTELAASEALARLGGIVRPRRSLWQAVEAGLTWGPRDEPPFVGTITGNRFRLRRAIWYRNSFLPVISGHVTPFGDGTRIDLVFRLTVPAALFVACWLTGASVGAGAGVWHWLTTSDITGLVGLLLPLSGAGLIAAGFLPERRKALRILAKQFGAATRNRPLRPQSGPDAPR